MNPSLVLFGCFILCLTIFGTNGENNDEGIKAQAKDQHHSHQKSHQAHHRSHESAHQENHHPGLHHARRHRGYKARDANSSLCLQICEWELAAVARWFNNTKELGFFFLIIPPSIKQVIFGSINGTFTNTTFSNRTVVNGSDTNSNVTLFNGTISVNLNLLYDATVEWPILTYFAKLVGFILSRAHGLLELFNIFPEFAKIWKIILRGLSGGGGADILVDNLRDLFGFNGTFGGNLFNFTYWEHVWSPSGFIKGIEHEVESLANASNIFG